MTGDWRENDLLRFVVELADIKNQADSMGLFKTGQSLGQTITKANTELQEIHAGKHLTTIAEDGHVVVIGKVKPG